MASPREAQRGLRTRSIVMSSSRSSVARYRRFRELPSLYPRTPRSGCCLAHREGVAVESWLPLTDTMNTESRASGSSVAHPLASPTSHPVASGRVGPCVPRREVAGRPWSAIPREERGSGCCGRIRAPGRSIRTTLRRPRGARTRCGRTPRSGRPPVDGAADGPAVESSRRTPAEQSAGPGRPHTWRRASPCCPAARRTPHVAVRRIEAPARSTPAGERCAERRLQRRDRGPLARVAICLRALEYPDSVRRYSTSATRSRDEMAPRTRGCARRAPALAAAPPPRQWPAPSRATRGARRAAPAWCPRSRADLRSPARASSRSRSAASRASSSAGIAARDAAMTRGGAHRHRGQPQRVERLLPRQDRDIRVPRAHRPLASVLVVDRIPRPRRRRLTQRPQVRLSFASITLLPSARAAPASSLSPSSTGARGRFARAPRSHRFCHCLLRGARPARAIAALRRAIAAIASSATAASGALHAPAPRAAPSSVRAASARPALGAQAPVEAERRRQRHLRHAAQRELRQGADPPPHGRSGAAHRLQHRPRRPRRAPGGRGGKCAR